MTISTSVATGSGAGRLRVSCRDAVNDTALPPRLPEKVSDRLTVAVVVPAATVTV